MANNIMSLSTLCHYFSVHNIMSSMSLSTSFFSTCLEYQTCSFLWRKSLTDPFIVKSMAAAGRCSLVELQLRKYGWYLMSIMKPISASRLKSLLSTCKKIKHLLRMVLGLLALLKYLKTLNFVTTSSNVTITILHNIRLILN